MNNITRILRSSTARGILFNANRYLHIDLISKNNVIPLVVQAQQEKNPWIWQQNDKIKVPVIQKINRIDLPNGLTWVPPELNDPCDNFSKSIEAPAVPSNNIPKEAIRIIVIRRKKMKKHKLRKLRKRMKFVWAKLRQKRELKKEKAFQAVLIHQIKEAEQFSAEKYVQERIDKLNEIVVPRFWNGRRLPEFLIREKMGLPPKK
ncbi:unnamed protein product [Acanthoscelides obtectus]|uniref:Small ribosomal subunit protein mS38 n=1 Tax=Acanthoscelides obtectus TaxID=200917 RepID=A0A9P0P5Y1_ACAOB|nr:unnamed protein product [Acanthoscelides obtectus]CAK1646715.1 hypothetical protein AOBTE_LOCUS14834 [Acanthoscelides obtectus]